MARETKMVRLGDYIELCDERNDKELYTADDVVGVSNLKSIIPTKAHLEGVSLTSYKVLRPQECCFVPVTSRNGGKISVSINNTDNVCIVSATYIVFKVKDANVLSPGFLYLCFNRPAFDRYARFNSWGSARETFDWGEMCRVEVPLPPISVQREISHLYHCASEARRLALEAEALMGELCPALIELAKHT